MTGQVGPRRERGRTLRDVLTALVVVLPIAAVYLLPPDTSLAEMEKIGVLTACVPASYPPLVTGDPADPGYDVSLLQLLAKGLGVRLALNVNPTMGRDFNLRNWRINRAQCQILAGGVIGTGSTRSFLDTLETGVETGWAVIKRDGGVPIARGDVMGIYPGSGGLNRVAVSTFLRQQGVRAQLVASPAALAEGLENGAFSAGIIESLGAGSLARQHPGWVVQWLSDGLERYPLSLGLWKGDLTLKRKLAGLLAQFAGDGTLARLRARYAITPVDMTAKFAP